MNKVPERSVLSDEVHGLLAQERYLQALERLLPRLYPQADPEAAALREEAFAALGRGLCTARHPPRTRMKFGTSGWRGLLFEDFTVANVQRVTQAVVDVVLGGSAALLTALGVQDLAELRRRGAILAHDTRFFGPELAAAVAQVLLAHDIPVLYLGVATTPEVSAALYETRAAFSINLTPSHNPYSYQGYKLNPADGGPATRDLTGPIEVRANQIFDAVRESRGGPAVADLPVRALSAEALAVAQREGRLWRRADPVALYQQSLCARLPFLDPRRLAQRINAAGLDLFIDNGFGATIGKYQALLAEVEPRRLWVMNAAPDFLFGGQSREPSAQSFAELQRPMAGSPARLCLGVINDGDGDRFIGGGRHAILAMNRFGPMVVRYLTQRLGLRGDVTRSLMTSHMADAARARYASDGALHETKVGFQHLKAFIPTSLNSFEESDGMSPLGWSMDKDGLVAALLLCAMVLDEGRTPEELDAQLTAELGHFDFAREKRSGGLSGEALARAINARFAPVQPGQELAVAGLLQPLTVARVERSDGVKIVFANGWWFGVRASGTEPAARIYVETCAPPGADPGTVAALAAARQALQDHAAQELALAV